jgi:hypothetical protein
VPSLQGGGLKRVVRSKSLTYHDVQIAEGSVAAPPSAGHGKERHLRVPTTILDDRTPERNAVILCLRPKAQPMIVRCASVATENTAVRLCG